MYYYEVIPAKLFRKDAGFLTYSSATPLIEGQLVTIPLGKTTTTGLIYKKVAQPAFPTKPISKIIYSTPLPTHLVKLLHFLHDYYLIPYPTALSLILPQGVEKHRRRTEQTSPKSAIIPKLPIIALNNAQKIALEALQKAPEGTKLLHGVTGSGKTNIYLEMAKNALQANKSTILLVPEIALTSQLVRVFEDTFGQKVTLIHSNQTESERHRIWESLLEGGEKTAFGGNPQLRRGLSDEARDDGPEERPPKVVSQPPRIVIGPRSALFAPLHNLGLIIIDECHESTYYQESTPKYSALRLASFIAKTTQIPCILGSATPTIEDYYLAKAKNSLIPLQEKAKSTAKAPTIKIIDFKKRDNFTKNRYFSTPLLKDIEDNLRNGHQTLIFHNRRGSAPLSICEDCGEELLCPTCFLPLTLHADTYQLVCHTCGYQQSVPHTCPKCGSPNLLHKGFGTKLLETELQKLFKTARIARFDADTAKNSTLSALYDEVKSGKINIIIGTQSVAKGLDLPKLATVGIVQADAGLSLPDYAAEEKTFELITQVIGRVGRGHLDKANVFIQTFRPDDPTIQYAIHTDYHNFANYLLSKRHNGHFPPYSYLAKLEITMKTESIVIQKIRTAYTILQKNPALTISVPTPTFHERTLKGYTWQLIIRAQSRAKLIAALSPFSNSNFRITLDPPSLL